MRWPRPAWHCRETLLRRHLFKVESSSHLGTYMYLGTLVDTDVDAPTGT